MAAVGLIGSVSETARRVAGWATVALGFSIPVSTALDNVLVAVLALCWVMSGRYREKLEVLRSNSFVVFPVALVVLHLLGALYSQGSMAEILYALDKASVLLLIPVVVSLRLDARTRSSAMYAFMAAVVVTLVLSFLVWLGAIAGGGIIKGIAEDPSVFKMHITHSVLMGFGAFMFGLEACQARHLGVRLGFAVVATLAVANVLLMVHSRTGQLVVMALLIYFLLSQLSWRGRATAALIICVLGAGTYLTPSTALHERVRASLQELEDWRAGKAPTERNLRLESWRNSVDIVREHPIVGVGTGGFAAAYRQRVDGTTMRAVGQPENQYLMTTVELGVVGLAILLALFVAHWRLASRVDTDLARGLVVAMAVGCLFNSFLLDHTEALFYAWLSGLLFGRPNTLATREFG